MSGGPTTRAVCHRACWSIGARALVANLAGALVTFLYLEFLAPSERRSGEASFALEVALFVVYIASAAALLGWRTFRRLDRALRWAGEERQPTPPERDATLAIPFHLAAGPLLAWAAGAAFFGPISLVYGHSGAHVVRIAVSVLLGGLASTAISYLLIERACRPLFALALADGARPSRVTSPGVSARLVLTWALVSGVPLLGLALLPLQAENAEVNVDIDRAVVVLSVAGLVAGALATSVVARSVSEPLADVRHAVRRVETGDLDVHVAVDDGGEVGSLQVGVNQMVAGLRERARIADLFGRHVGTEVASFALEQGTGMCTEQREASVLFVDIVGSTAMAEILAPEEVVATLNAFFATVVDVVAAEGGWVNKFEGDGAMCVFGAPAVQPDHAARALRAGRALDLGLRKLSDRFPGVDAAIGISSGTVVAGNVGTAARYEYTLIGGPVNEAARLTVLAKDRPGRVLASWDTVARAGDEGARWRDGGTVALRGRSRPTTLAEPVVAALR